MGKVLRILLLADYPAGVEIAKFLKDKKENIVGVVIPSKNTTNKINKDCSKQILRILRLPKECIFHQDDLNESFTLKRIKDLKLDLGLSIFWGELLSKKLISLFNLGIINLHLSYLPHNRGRNPNVWPIIDGTPAGVTLHFIDEGADTGAIIFQERVEVLETDTGGSLYNKLVVESIKIFKKRWAEIKNGEYKLKQQEIKYKAHTKEDLRMIDRIDLDKEYKASELLNILRARTFEPFPSAYFINKSGEKVYVRIAFEKINK